MPEFSREMKVGLRRFNHPAGYSGQLRIVRRRDERIEVRIDHMVCLRLDKIETIEFIQFLEEAIEV